MGKMTVLQLFDVLSLTKQDKVSLPVQPVVVDCTDITRAECTASAADR